MPRNVTTSFRRNAEASFSDEVDLVFLTISHDTFDDDIRVVWDTKDFIFHHAQFTGFPFDITILSDDENPPTAQLTIQNVDPRIGDAIRALTSPPRLKIELASSDDFNIGFNPRRPTYEFILEMHFNGVDASTSFDDDSFFDQNITPHGSAQIDTAQSKFGGASGLFNGTTDYLSIDPSDDFAFGEGDFTVHAQVRPRTSVAGNHAIITTENGNGFEFYMQSGKLAVFADGNDIIVGSITMAINTWYHVALTRHDGVFRIYVNAVFDGSYNATSINFTADTAIVGNDGAGGSERWNGWVDELYAIKGAAIWSNEDNPSFDLPDDENWNELDPTVIYSADRLFLINVSVDIMQVTGQIVGWDYLQRVWPAPRGTQAVFPGLFR